MVDRYQARNWEVISNRNYLDIKYPKLLANVVLVKKSNMQQRMCMNFADLNKHCSKDCYSLPKIDMLVDIVVRYPIMSFLDAFLGYHQFVMVVNLLGKPPSWMTRHCIVTMPFKLKNVGATYQRIINIIFNLQNRRNVEAYAYQLKIGYLIQIWQCCNFSQYLIGAFFSISKYFSDMFLR